MDLYIKNSDIVNHTYQGQLIENSAYYKLSTSETESWSNDSSLLIDIANSKAVVAKSNSGSDDISSVNDGINYLKGFNQINKTQQILSQDGLTSRPFGFDKVSCTAGSTTTHYFLIDETIALRGGFIETTNNVHGDSFDFDIEDKDGNYYPAGTVLSAYVKHWNCKKDGFNELLDESISDPLPVNVYGRLKYKSTGGTDVNVTLTLFGYK